MPITLKDYFSDEELACRCGRPACNAVSIRPSFRVKLNLIRERSGVVMPVTSGTRCKFWNEHPSVRGSPNSWHLRGRAADIALPNDEARYRVTEQAFRIGVTGIYVYSWGLHLDDRDGSPALGIFG